MKELQLHSFVLMDDNYSPLCPLLPSLLEEFEGNVEDDGWQSHKPVSGQKLLEPQPLFSKLDEGLIEEETSRLGIPAE